MADNIETSADFKPTPEGWAQRFSVEMNAAKKNQKDWIEAGEKVVKRFLDNRTAAMDGDTRVNLFTANVQTLRALLYGKTPAVDVKRRFADPGDDEARVAGEILQRMLNTDIERDGDTYATALENALDDRLLPGLGVVRVRYEAEFEEQEEVAAILDDEGNELAPGYTPEPKKTYECVETDYVHWKDFRWSPARTWDEIRWVAFRNAMTREALVKRFGEDVGKKVPLNAKVSTLDNEDGEKNNPWSRAEVWEIWSKEHRKVFWWVEGHEVILDVKDDPYGLDGFWPVPRPMCANVTTTKFIPKPDFVLAQDLYNEVDMVSTRITLLERAVAVRGVYDKTSPEIKRLLSETVGNELIPTDNFSVFKEKGGLAAVVDWLPLEVIVGALDKLREYRTELMALLFQVTGMSDIMRGQGNAHETATAQAIKAKFASTRVQEFQNEFARFASDAQSLKAELISKHFDPQTILETSNVKYMTGNDPMLAQRAVEIIKSDIYQYRVEVKPESVAMADMAAVKQERSEFLMAMSQFLQSSVPMAQAAPWATPFLLQMLQWAIAGFRGGATIEGVLDQMVLAAQQFQKMQAMQPPQPDPKLIQVQAKVEADNAKAQTDIMAKQMDIRAKMAETQINLQAQAMKHRMDLTAAAGQLQVDREKKALDMQHAQESHEMSLKQQEAKLQAEARKPEGKDG